MTFQINERLPGSSCADIPAVATALYDGVINDHRDDDQREEHRIDDAESFQDGIRRDKARRQHAQNTGPDTKCPDEADILRGFPLHDPPDERDIKERH